MKINPPAGLRHVGCPTCGLVDMVPVDRVDEARCFHSGRAILIDGPSLQQRTKMIAVVVNLNPGEIDLPALTTGGE